MNRTTSHSCIECDEVITEPICPDCLAKRMRLVVKEHDQTLAREIKGYVVEEGETTCLFCGKNMNLCAHCFSREVYELVKERRPEAAEEFLSRFDFELRREVSS